MTNDINSILLAVAGFLFAIALIALTAWGFKAFVLSGGRDRAGFLKGREKRLGWSRLPTSTAAASSC